MRLREVIRPLRPTPWSAAHDRRHRHTVPVGRQLAGNTDLHGQCLLVEHYERPK